MAYTIQPSFPERKQKQFVIKFPDLSGKFGVTFSFGKKEIFIGIAVANVETETVTRKKKQKVFYSSSGKNKLKVINF